MPSQEILWPGHRDDFRGVQERLLFPRDMLSHAGGYIEVQAAHGFRTPYCAPDGVIADPDAPQLAVIALREQCLELLFLQLPVHQGGQGLSVLFTHF